MIPVSNTIWKAIFQIKQIFISILICKDFMFFHEEGLKWHNKKYWGDSFIGNNHSNASIDSTINLNEKSEIE